MELNFGAWELRRFDEITDPQLQCWYDDYLYEAPTGGESFYQQTQRVADFLDELCAELANENSPEGEVLIFTHRGVLLGAGIWAGLFTLAEAFDLWGYPYLRNLIGRSKHRGSYVSSRRTPGSSAQDHH